MWSLMKKNDTQLDKFKRTARELECDENEARWNEKLRKVVKQKPAPVKSK